MTATITSTNRNPISVASGGTAIPFSYVHVDDPTIFGTGGMSGGGSGYLTITLHSTSGLLGTVSDPAQTFEQPNVSYDAAAHSSTYRERTYGGPHSGGFNALPDQILSRLRYTAPTLADGQTAIVYGTVSYTSDVSGGHVRPTPSLPNLVTVTEPNTVTLELGAPLAAVVPPVATVPPATVAPVVMAPMLPPAPPPVHFGITNLTTGAQSVAAGNTYTGPVAGLAHELLLITPDNLAVVSAVPNVFIHSGSGTDAIDVSKASGNNVLDGGGGSDFLVGGAGNDTFFLDTRGTAATWSTVENFHSGDAATVWGITPQNFALQWLDNQGAPGHTGLTLAATAAGKPNANLTLAGFSTADLTNGKLATVFGSNAGGNYLFIKAV